MSKLEVGSEAPDFKAKNQNGEEVALSDFRGEKVVLYFYPKDDTPGCTAEACNLRDNVAKFKAEGYKILGVSTDSVASHQKFAEKYDLPFDLIADEDKTIVNAYDVYGEKNMFGKKFMGTKRVTFLIDEEGKISKIFKKVKAKDHTNQILA